MNWKWCYHRVYLEGLRKATKHSVEYLYHDWDSSWALPSCRPQVLWLKWTCLWQGLTSHVIGKLSWIWNRLRNGKEIIVSDWLVIKSKLSLYRPLGPQKVEAARTARQSAHASGKAVSPMHRLPLPPRRYPWYSFLLGLSWLQQLMCSAVGKF